MYWKPGRPHVMWSSVRSYPLGSMLRKWASQPMALFGRGLESVAARSPTQTRRNRSAGDRADRIGTSFVVSRRSMARCDYPPGDAP